MLVRRIGCGGFGEVYEAIGRDARVAIKVLRVASRDDVARFAREIRCVRLLEHPNTPRLIELGELADGRPYYVMELLDGETLADRVARCGPLPFDEVVAIVRDAASVLEAAHARGIVHLDVTPSNVFLADRPVLLDFGIAKLLDDTNPSRCRAQTIVGSPMAIAPEQYLGRSIDARTDIYGLAVVSYFALSGGFPFCHANPEVLEALVLAGEPAPMTPAIDGVLRAALASDPAARPPSALAFAEALERAAHRDRDLPPRHRAGSRAETTSSRPRARVDRADAARAELVAVFPRGQTWRVTLDATPRLIGRHRDGLDDRTVSRCHCAITWSAERRHHVVTDTGSRNGTFVDGVRVGEVAVELAAGSVLRLGDLLLVYDRSADTVEDPCELGHVHGNARAIRELRAAIARAAPDRAPVLVHGETGTGKEYVVRALHQASGRRGPLVAVNCAALSAHLVEAQLFGHVHGAFTGATTDHAGHFRSAHGGTLFLDEIGELPLELQPKLLRALTDRAILPVGGTRPIDVDVRVIAATNRTLADDVAAHRFRRDLYARLAMWELGVPALRERRSDLLGWLDKLRAERAAPGAPLLALHPDAAERLLLHDWPENLRGVARLAHALAGSGTRAVELPELPAWLWRSPTTTTAAAARPPARRAAPSRDRLEQLYVETAGNIRRMARLLACDRRQVYRWLDGHGLGRRA